ncbi:MAG: arsenosugar biosynthesis radical SAM (seleno)protein ArsS [Chloroflexota bacterium]
MDFRAVLSSCGLSPLRAIDVGTLQVNLGYRCNMSCKHCHVQAGPGRIEEMGGATLKEVKKALRENGVRVLDLTGGAPELHSEFRNLVGEARGLGAHVIVRSNLTVLTETGMKDLPEFFGSHSVEVVASLPHYTPEPVDRVRGQGAFLRSIEALRKLNELGYGSGTGSLKLGLVFNPQGAFLPPTQRVLEQEYRRELGDRYGIAFDALYTFTNMPIGRFRDFLVRSGNFTGYMRKLADAFNPATLSNVMCRHLVSVRWDGALHDCDFNQILGLPLHSDCPSSIADFDHSGLAKREIAVGDHCFGCTAGQGST